MCAGSGRSSRVVVVPRRWDQVRERFHGRRRLASPALRREREVSRKPSCRECRTVRRPVVTMLVGRLPFSAHEAAGAAGARHSLRPLSSEGHGCSQNPGRVRAAGMLMAVCNSNQMAPRDSGITSPRLRQDNRIWKITMRLWDTGLIPPPAKRWGGKADAKRRPGWGVIQRARCG
jgi:hypothetical protein